MGQDHSRLRFHKKELGLVIVWLSSFAIPNCVLLMEIRQQRWQRNKDKPAGFWKSTGRDTAVYDKSKLIGIRTTLAFYKGRAELSRSCVNIYFNLMQMVLHSLLSIISLSLSVSQLLR
ncbi:hypothetical protein WN943_025262 [Citrus x changshan-huyou]